jgi:hypothetical protein
LLSQLKKHHFNLILIKKNYISTLIISQNQIYEQLQSKRLFYYQQSSIAFGDRINFSDGQKKFEDLEQYQIFSSTCRYKDYYVLPSL